MALTAGTSVGPYTITGSLGAGGMGEVYRATDTNLKRDVAIKVLPESFVTDTNRLARFQREAEVLASLNHSNIAQIFGLEKFSGGTALVMELVEGSTLADRVARGALPPSEALDAATQIAAALEAAHEQGIVHRDLKPANVKLKPDGTVKVLDFGIAKALDTRIISGPQAPALTTPAMTAAGLVLGTAAYMSPEQARGKAVDKRADIWAFGCVLYEMLTGQPAFGGEDVTTTLARVLERDPDMRELPPPLSPAVGRTIELCLQKDPKKRLRDIGDVRLALAGRFETNVAQLAPTHAASGLRHSVGPILAGVLLGGALVALAAARLWPEAEPKAVKRFALSLPAGQVLAGPEFRILDLSPNGMTLVYASVGGLRVRDLATLEDRPVLGTDLAWSPTFSPDGQAVAYLADAGEVRRIAASGGTAMSVAGPPAGGSGGLVWAPDGTLLLTEPRGIVRMPATGGTSELIVEAEGAFV